MSRRTFLRRFKANTGTTPGAWLAAARVARARELLKSSDAAIEEVAATAGFGSAATLRHHFRKQMKLSPAAYRRQFGMEASASTAGQCTARDKRRRLAPIARPSASFA